MDDLKLKDKRLLVLGAAGGEDCLKKFRNREGIKIITTADPQYQIGELYDMADEVYDVSPFDEEGLCRLVREKKIDGFFSGGNEGIIDVLIHVAHRLNLPFYVNEKQFRLNRDKKYCKEQLKKYGLMTPLEYVFTNEPTAECLDNVTYPVIVKPVDGCGGRGVFVCYNIEDLTMSYKKAMCSSKIKKVIVEEYLKGDEFTALYTIKNGIINLSCVRDIYLSQFRKDTTSQWDAQVIPSRYTREYVKSENEKILKMLKDFQFRDGVVWISGIVKKGRFYFFEMGCRISGSYDYKLISYMNNVNYYEMLLFYALEGSDNDYDVITDSPFYDKYGIIFSLFAHAGIIGMQKGLEQIVRLPNVITAEFKKSVGDSITENETGGTEVFRSYIVADNMRQIKETIVKIQRKVRVLSNNGESLLYPDFCVERLKVEDIDREREGMRYEK